MGAQVISLAMALCTVTGIAAIAPFFAVLGEPRLIHRNKLLRWLFDHGGFWNERRLPGRPGAGIASRWFSSPTWSPQSTTWP